jgi:hypothetical protein
MSFPESSDGYQQNMFVKILNKKYCDIKMLTNYLLGVMLDETSMNFKKIDEIKA